MPAYLRRTPPSELTATSYADVSSMLTALGSSYEGQVRLISKSTGLTIGRWAYVGTAITPIGPIQFDRVTATPTGAAASVAGAVVTVSAGHTLATLAKVLRVQVVTDGTWSDVASGQWSVSGNDVTVPAAAAAAIAAALGAGKAVRMHVEGVSELCIGASPCALQPDAGSSAYFTGAGVVAGPTVVIPSIQWSLLTSIRVQVAAWTGAAAGEYVGVGWRKTAVAVSGAAGFTATPELKQGVYIGSYPGATVTDVSEIGIANVCRKADDFVQFSVVTKGIAAGASCLTTNPYTATQMTGCVAVLRSSPAATFSRLVCY